MLWKEPREFNFFNHLLCLPETIVKSLLGVFFKIAQLFLSITNSSLLPSKESWWLLPGPLVLNFFSCSVFWYVIRQITKRLKLLFHSVSLIDGVKTILWSLPGASPLAQLSRALTVQAEDPGSVPSTPNSIRWLTTMCNSTPGEPHIFFQPSRIPPHTRHT